MKRLFFLLLILQLPARAQQLNSLVAKHPVTDPEHELPILLQHIKDAKTLESKAQSQYLAGICYEYMNREEVALQCYFDAKKSFKAAGKEALSQEIALDIHRVISSQKNYGDYPLEYLEEFHDYAKKKNTPFLMSRDNNEMGKVEMDKFDGPDSNPGFLKSAEQLFRTALRQSIDAKDEKMTAMIFCNLGVVKKNAGQFDAARSYFDQAIAINSRIHDNCQLFINYLNYGNTYYYQGNYKKALPFYRLAESTPLSKYKKKLTALLYKKMLETFDFLGDDKNRWAYREKREQADSEINTEAQNNLIADLDAKYEINEAQNENALLQQENKFLASKRQVDKVLLITALALILVIIIVSLLWIKNLQRKKKIAEQDQLIQTQKLEKTMKDQELHGIDLMLDAQEKERQKIANELHDNLGSILATLKLNFQNLKRSTAAAVPRQDGLYDKTDTLLEEAYHKVRHIAHLKHLGVIGSEGLLVSVRKMAEQMNIPERFTVNVIPFGLDERLENSVEVFLFRSIQELCTNAIKYAVATELNIYLTQHGPSDINIMVEDNGVGFDTAMASGGIGLRNIEKKTEQLGGTFTVDSIKSKGTTIIINLPL